MTAPVRVAERVRPDDAAPRRQGGWPALHPTLVEIGVALGAFVAVALLARRFDTTVVAAAAIAGAATIPLIVRPRLATLLVVFLLYTNIPVIAYKYHGVPQPVAGAYLLLLLIPLGHHLLVRSESMRVDRTLGLMLLYLGVLLVASLRARSLDVAADRIQTFLLEGVLLYWLVVNVVRTLPALRQVVHVLLAAGALLGALSLYQEATGDFEQQFAGLAHRNYEFMVLESRLRADPDDPVLLEQKARMVDGRSRRAEGPLDEPNAFAQLLIVLLPLGVFAYRTGRSRRARIWAAAAGSLILGGILLTQSRGAMVGLVLLVGAGLLLRWLRPVHLAPLALAVGLGAAVLGPERLVQRFTSIGTAVEMLRRGPGTAGDADHAMRGRATEMLAAWQVFRDYPVLGVGPGQYAPFYSKEYHQRNPRYEFKDLATTRRAHSLYLELAAELGAVGLAAFLLIVGSLMRGLWRLRRAWTGPGAGGGPIAGAAERAELATALWLSLLAYLATGVFLHLMYERYFWILVALAGAGLAILRDPGPPVPVPGRPTPPLRSRA